MIQIGINIAVKGEFITAPLPPPIVLFTTTWTTTAPNQNVILPYSALGTYLGTIDWGDGTTSINSFANKIHSYALAGTYTVEINGTCIGWNFSSYGGVNSSYITSVVNWGQLQLGSDIGNYFLNCSNLNLSSVSDILDLTGIFNLNGMFSGSGVSSINNINSWNTSSVTNMGGMFYGTPSFNQALSFDTSSVTDMSYMFKSAISFNQSLSTFDTSSVIYMNGMFQSAISFNQSLSTFDTSSVIYMGGMFYDATSFNQNIGTWNVGNVIYFFDFMGNKTPATFSTTNLNSIYNGWSASGVQANCNISFGTAKYTVAASVGRAILTGVNSWIITDGGI